MLIQFFSDTFLPPDISQARRNRGGGWAGEAAAHPDFG